MIVASSSRVASDHSRLSFFYAEAVPLSPAQLTELSTYQQIFHLVPDLAGIGETIKVEERTSKNWVLVLLEIKKGEKIKDEAIGYTSRQLFL